MKSLMVNANAQYADELAKFALDPELLDLISGGAVKCKYCADVTTRDNPDGSQTISVDCVNC